MESSYKFLNGMVLEVYRVYDNMFFLNKEWVHQDQVGNIEPNSGRAMLVEGKTLSSEFQLVVWDEELRKKFKEGEAFFVRKIKELSNDGVRIQMETTLKSSVQNCETKVDYKARNFHLLNEIKKQTEKEEIDIQAVICNRVGGELYLSDKGLFKKIKLNKYAIDTIFNDVRQPSAASLFNISVVKDILSFTTRSKVIWNPPKDDLKLQQLYERNKYSISNDDNLASPDKEDEDVSTTSGIATDDNLNRPQMECYESIMCTYNTNHVEDDTDKLSFHKIIWFLNNGYNLMTTDETAEISNIETQLGTKIQRFENLELLHAKFKGRKNSNNRNAIFLTNDWNTFINAKFCDDFGFRFSSKLLKTLANDPSNVHLWNGGSIWNLKLKCKRFHTVAPKSCTLYEIIKTCNGCIEEDPHNAQLILFPNETTSTTEEHPNLVTAILSGIPKIKETRFKELIRSNHIMQHEDEQLLLGLKFFVRSANQVQHLIRANGGDLVNYFTKNSIVITIKDFSEFTYLQNCEIKYNKIHGINQSWLEKACKKKAFGSLVDGLVACPIKFEPFYTMSPEDFGKNKRKVFLKFKNKRFDTIKAQLKDLGAETVDNRHDADTFVTRLTVPCNVPSFSRTYICLTSWIEEGTAHVCNTYCFPTLIPKAKMNSFSGKYVWCLGLSQEMKFAADAIASMGGIVIRPEKNRPNIVIWDEETERTGLVNMLTNRRDVCVFKEGYVRSLLIHENHVPDNFELKRGDILEAFVKQRGEPKLILDKIVQIPRTDIDPDQDSTNGQRFTMKSPSNKFGNTKLITGSYEVNNGETCAEENNSSRSESVNREKNFVPLFQIPQGSSDLAGDSNINILVTKVKRLSQSSEQKEKSRVKPLFELPRNSPKTKPRFKFKRLKRAASKH